MPDYPIAAQKQQLPICRLHHRDWEYEMTELSRLDSQYDAFLFASVCETGDGPLSVLSVLARQDVDPWDEAARLAKLSRDQATHSLASEIWKSNNVRWSRSEASARAVRLVELLPSHAAVHSRPVKGEDRNGGLTLWIVVGMLLISIAMSGKATQKLTNDSSTSSSHGLRMNNLQENAVARSPLGVGTD